MESTSSIPGEVSTVKLKRPRPRLPIVIVSLFVIAAVVFTAFELPGLFAQGGVTLKTGDFFSYTVTGGNATTPGYFNITITHADSKGVGTTGEGSALPDGLGSGATDEVKLILPILGDPSGAGDHFRNERLATPFGVKCVQSILRDSLERRRDHHRHRSLLLTNL